MFFGIEARSQIKPPALGASVSWPKALAVRFHQNL